MNNELVNLQRELHKKNIKIRNLNIFQSDKPSHSSVVEKISRHQSGLRSEIQNPDTVISSVRFGKEFRFGKTLFTIFHCLCTLLVLHYHSQV